MFITRKNVVCFIVKTLLWVDTKTGNVEKNVEIASTKNTVETETV